MPVPPSASTLEPAPLAGRVALVTGVSRRVGIAATIARQMLLDGASVLASGWHPHDADQPWGADAGRARATIDFVTTDLLTLAAITDILRGVVLVLFVLSSLLVLLVVLAQEGKGGGLSGAFGGAGAETFGVKAGTVNAFTSWIAVAFLGLALLYAGLSSASKTDLESGSGVSTDQFTGSSGASDAAATDATDESAAGTTDGASDENTTPPDDAVDNGGDGDGDPDNGGNGGN